MYDSVILKLITKALETLLWVSGPMLVVAIVVGVVVSVIQTITSIQDATFAFAPRLVAIFLIFLFTFPWLLRVMVDFTAALFGNFAPFIR